MVTARGVSHCSLKGENIILGENLPDECTAGDTKAPRGLQNKHRLLL